MSVDARKYVFPVGEGERQRLDGQYVYMRSSFGWTKAVPDSIDISRVSNVLDIAAGTCHWLLDLASLPEIQEHVELVACDIETRFFPSETILEQAGITVFQQDATKPFDTKWLGHFDLIHISLLNPVLTREGWKKTLENVHQLLRPGGQFLIVETDPIWYPVDKLPTDAEGGHDLTNICVGPGWIARANQLCAGYLMDQGLILGLTFLLPAMLTSAGFDVVDRGREPAPFGKACRLVKNKRGEDLSEYESFTLKNMKGIVRAFGPVVMAKGKLTKVDGTRITDIQELESTIVEVETMMREEGCAGLMGYVVASRK